MIPIILYTSIKVGDVILGNNNKLVFDTSLNLMSIKLVFFQYVIGSISLAIISGSIVFVLSYFLLKNFSLASISNENKSE